MVLISVFMPSFNHDKYISESIESVLGQSFHDLELIIVDDCSKDGSRKIIESYQAKDQRVRAFFHKQNMGIAKTLNHCIAESKGKYISLIGSDDVWVESKLEKELKILEKDDSLVVWSEGIIIDENSMPTGETFSQLNGASNKKKSGDLFSELLPENFIFGQSLLFKKTIIQNIKFDERLKYYNDFEFVVDLASKYCFFFIDEPLAKYRVHGKNSILRDEKNWIKDKIIMNEYFLEKYNDRLTKSQQASLFFNIGKAFLSISKPKSSKYFFFKAAKSAFFRDFGVFCLILALTTGKKPGHNFLLNFYLTLDFYLMKLTKKVLQANFILKEKAKW